MAILKDGSVVNGDLMVSGNIYTDGDTTTDIMTKINSNYAKIKQMLGTAISLPVTYDLKGTVNSAPIAYLIGNTLRTSFNITLAESISGNIDNLQLGTVTCTHNGKIRAKVNAVFMDGPYGGQAAGWVSATLTDTTIELSYEIISAANAFSRIGTYCANAVAPNLDAF